MGDGSWGNLFDFGFGNHLSKKLLGVEVLAHHLATLQVSKSRIFFLDIQCNAALSDIHVDFCIHSYDIFL